MDEGCPFVPSRPPTTPPPIQPHARSHLAHLFTPLARPTTHAGLHGKGLPALTPPPIPAAQDEGAPAGASWGRATTAPATPDLAVHEEGAHAPAGGAVGVA